ncbi:MAG: hypothetical protein A4E50_01823 [Methanosaeta sp. PtaB.Bin087]|nr:MAG: hypothetical protein A4E50_01823 [Methanosaeta sp. PtaB.Bin087]OPY50235.1 MAG: hypothetical protein A4E51_01788 [Methanosaeta sp. PtaU1.Bin055]
MRSLVVLALILALIGGSMNAAGHRMFVGQRMTVSLSAIYDDGEPAIEASIQVFRDGSLYSENKTDYAGSFSMVLPEKGTGDWRFVVSSDGHEEETHFSIRDDREAATPNTAVAMGLLALPAVWIWGRRGGI